MMPAISPAALYGAWTIVSWLNRRIDEGIREMSASIAVELLDLFEEPALGIVSYTTAPGQIVPFPMWVDYHGTHLLASSPVGSKKGRSLRVRCAETVRLPRTSPKVDSVTRPTALVARGDKDGQREQRKPPDAAERGQDGLGQFPSGHGLTAAQPV
jgi:hypothetical protein